MHDLINPRCSHLLLEPAQRDLRIKIVSVLVPDRKVPRVIPRCYRNAHNISVTPSPSGAKGGEVRVSRLKVHGYFFVARQVRKLARDIPIGIKVIHFHALNETNRLIFFRHLINLFLRPVRCNLPCPPTSLDVTCH